MEGGLCYVPGGRIPPEPPRPPAPRPPPPGHLLLPPRPCQRASQMHTHSALTHALTPTPVPANIQTSTCAHSHASTLPHTHVCPHSALTQPHRHALTLANTFSHVFGFCSWARGGGCDLRSELRPGKQAQRPVCCLINTDGWGSGWSQTGRERERPEAEGMTQKWGWRGV